MTISLTRRRLSSHTLRLLSQEEVVEEEEEKEEEAVEEEAEEEEEAGVSSRLLPKYPLIISSLLGARSCIPAVDDTFLKILQ